MSAVMTPRRSLIKSIWFMTFEKRRCIKQAKVSNVTRNDRFSNVYLSACPLCSYSLSIFLVTTTIKLILLSSVNVKRCYSSLYNNTTITCSDGSQSLYLQQCIQCKHNLISLRAACKAVVDVGYCRDPNFIMFVP